MDEGDAAPWPLLLDAASALEEQAGRPANALRLAAASEERRAKIGGGPGFIVDVAHVIADAPAAAPELAHAALRDGERLDDDALAALIRERQSQLAAGPPQGVAQPDEVAHVPLTRRRVLPSEQPQVPTNVAQP